jgi:D-alanine-D-alanine ligase
VKKRRILLLVNEALVPPDDMRGLSEDEIEACRTEYNVLSTLSNLGHEVRVLGIGDKIGELRRVIRDWRPEITFNLLEEFSGIVTYDHYVVAFLELMRQPYTGCNPRGMMLSRDKVLTKQILAYHRIPTPHFHLFPWGKPYREPRGVQFPLIVKSATEDASLGIAQASVVDDAARLRERIEFMHEQIGSDALVEEYIEGRELYVGVLGNGRIVTLPAWQMHFGSLPGSLPAIATRKVKWDRKYQQKYGITTGSAGDLEPAVRQRLDRLARRIYRSLHLSGYARIDFRVRADGAIYVLEANPNPNLAREEDFAASALAAGLDYRRLLERILSLGRGYRAEWREFYGQEVVR